MIRVCKDGKKKYVSLGVSVLPQFWDFTKNQPKKNCPNKAYIEKIIADKSSEFAERIIELKAEKKEFTATTLTEHLTDGTRAKRTVGEVFLSQIENLKQTGRTGYALSHREVYNSLLKFNGHLNIYFSEIDTVFRIFSTHPIPMPPAFSKPPERVLSLLFPSGHGMRRQLRLRVRLQSRFP